MGTGFAVTGGVVGAGLLALGVFPWVPLGFLAVPAVIYARRLLLLLWKTPGFRTHEGIITERLRLLRAKEVKLNEIKSSIDTSQVSAALTSTRHLIEDTLPILQKMVDRYETQMWGIRIARLKNRVEPVLFRSAPERVSHIETDINQINAALDNCAQLLSDPNVSRLVGSEITDTSESLKSMLQILYTEQTRLTIQGVSPLSETRPGIDLSHYRQAFDTTAQSAVLRISISRLEEEYDRIAAEESLT